MSALILFLDAGPCCVQSISRVVLRRGATDLQGAYGKKSGFGLILAKSLGRHFPDRF